MGNISSYPTRAQKAAKLSSNSGLQIGPQAVGQGSTGFTELILTVGNEWSTGGALEKGFTIDMENTAGTIVAGVSFGASVTDTVRITSGSSTTYRASVGTLNAANHAANGFSFGLFTYVETDPTTGQEFDVVQYWVE